MQPVVRHPVRFPSLLFCSMLAFVALAGCSKGPLPGLGEAPPRCEDVSVPALHQGDRITYSLQGDLITPAAGPVLIDFREIDPQQAPSHPGLFSFDAGSRLTMTAVPGAQERLAASGELQEALQIAYVAHPAGYDGSLHGLDEWLSLDGQMVQSHSRIIDHSLDVGKRLQGIQTTGLGGPALMAAHLFAGQVLDEDWTANITIPPKELPGTGATSPGYYSAAVTKMRSGPCRAVVELRIQWPDPGESSQVASYRGYRVDLELGADAPAPLTYVTNWTGRAEGAPLSLELTEFAPGSGAALPPLRAQTAPVAAFAPTSLTNGFPSEETCRYGTCLADALEALEMHPQVASWFVSHPDATPFQMAHRLGDPTGPFVDEWAFEWADEAERLAAIYRPLRPEALVADPGAASGSMMVEVKESRGAATPPSASISIDGLASIQETTLGAPPEVLSCDFVLLVCQLNTHEISGVPRVVAAGDAPPLLSDGIMVSMTSGLVIQVNLRGDALLAPTP